MRSFEDALTLVLALSKEAAAREKSKRDYMRSPLAAADKAEKVLELDDQIRELQRRQHQVLRDLVLFPPQHLHLQAAFDQFDKPLAAAGKTYDKRVFIMTKYPDGTDAALDAQLQTVIDTVCAAVTKNGCHPQLAKGQKLHPNLWENLVCQMLGCRRGIAIVEERFDGKLNPNVAMEWGWMRAMNKDVIYLVEKKALHAPADVQALIQDRFDWDDPAGTIPLLLDAGLN